MNIEIHVLPRGYFIVEPHSIGMTDQEIASGGLLAQARTDELACNLRCAMQRLAEVKPEGQA